MIFLILLTTMKMRKKMTVIAVCYYLHHKLTYEVIRFLLSHLYYLMLYMNVKSYLYPKNVILKIYMKLMFYNHFFHIDMVM
ncbi:unnamed protein product [Schistosoma margrebowiei]|uniref:Uncharacterized protein n=1 Tax=Schistosoma margrebowiei TaxID=48269 RepID=A0A3P7W0W4_9TREM|nr:unnamed protein product [Schistosoma margrebowiei]